MTAKQSDHTIAVDKDQQLKYCMCICVSQIGIKNVVHLITNSRLKLTLVKVSVWYQGYQDKSKTTQRYTLCYISE